MACASAGPETICPGPDLGLALGDGLREKGLVSLRPQTGQMLSVETVSETWCFLCFWVFQRCALNVGLHNESTELSVTHDC